MKASELRAKYLNFFKERKHTIIPSASLVPENDPTTLFTSSGMQPLIPYLLGEMHPLGIRLVNSQRCFRSQDIEEVGDNRHTTFFEMLGNWSLGDYFKKEQLTWFFEFLINKEEGLGLNPQKLYVTVFEGDSNVPKDQESIEIWQELFAKVGIEAKEGERIFAYDVKKNWWSRSGTPEEMPVGEIGGPDSEVFYEFSQVEHDQKFGRICHPNCDCGRFLEIGNSVFIQYKKVEGGKLEELSQKNVDFGGGLERQLAAVANEPDIFKIDLFSDVIRTIEEFSDKKYLDKEDQGAMRVIADHVKASVFLILDGVLPSNKAQGYVLRRLLRRAAIKMHKLGIGLKAISFKDLVSSVFNTYGISEQKNEVEKVIENEISKFSDSLERGLKELEKMESINGKEAFDLYQTYGFPLELTLELVKEKGWGIDKKEFEEEFKKHQEISRAGLEQKFKGGLADHSEIVVRGHTATHLLHQALRDVLGEGVLQRGSNITPERIRFDFSFDRKLTQEEIKRVEEIVNQKVKEDLSVRFEILPLEEARKVGAIGLFGEKYGEQVKIYFIGDYSKEFCGGPHVEKTSQVGHFKIAKEEALGAGQRRIRAVLEN